MFGGGTGGQVAFDSGAVSSGGESGTGGTSDPGGTGGDAAETGGMGVPGSGGAAASGGTGGGTDPGSGGNSSGTGGRTGTGGAIGTGGHPATGGAVGTGGRPGTGGSATGGVTGSGGKVGTGGAPGSGGTVGTGGVTGTGGAGLPQATCDTLAASYKEEMPHAKTCSGGLVVAKVAIVPIIPRQCALAVPSALGCNPCRTFVNNDTTLASIKAQWDSGNCDRFVKNCLLIACLNPSSATCTSTATGTFSCKDQTAILTQ